MSRVYLRGQGYRIFTVAILLRHSGMGESSMLAPRVLFSCNEVVAFCNQTTVVTFVEHTASGGALAL